jgi:hypothetical protein
MPGLFVFPALAIDAVVERARGTARRAAWLLAAVCVTASLGTTVYDYFVSWASLPELPLAFDADMVEASKFAERQPADRPVYVSTEVYRHPTLMLLSKHVPTSQYFDRATCLREFDARTTLLFSPDDQEPLHVFVRDRLPPEAWLRRIAPEAASIERGEYINVYRLGSPEAPIRVANLEFNPFLKLFGYSIFENDAAGLALYWQVTELPTNRAEAITAIVLLDARGQVVGAANQPFGVPPMEWQLGDRIIEWFTFPVPLGAAHFRLALTRGDSTWESPALTVR